MSKFTKDITVDIHDVDPNGVARASALMKYVQLTAQTQLTENGMSYDELKDKKRVFLLSRMKLCFDRPVHAFEKLHITTFPCESKGFTFLRCYKTEMDGETVGRAVSMWALIDTDSRALVRVNDFDLNLKTYDPIDLTADRFVIPGTLEEVGKYKVTYGDLDQNRHMNNTRYPDMYSEFLPLDGRRIREITINYQNEAPAGSTLTVLRSEYNGIYYFRTLREDGKTNSEAEIKLCEI